MKLSDKLVSVIVPVYNIENYICQCVESIIRQSYKELEIILVDDGSTDSSPSLCDDYAKHYQKVVVIHKENGGLSDARNVGIKIAKGDYISFIDGDDYVDKDFIFNLFIGIEKNRADIAIGSIYRDDNSVIGLLDDNRFNKDMVLSKKKAMRYLASEGKLTTCAWDKLYKRDLLPWLCFPKGKLFEDKYIMHQVFSNCSKIVIVPEARYYYVTRSGSITNSRFSHKMMDNLDASNKRLKYYRKHYPQFVKHVKANQCDIAFNLYISSRHDRSGKEYRRYIKKIIRKDIVSFILEKDYRTSEKIRIIVRFISFYIGAFDIYKLIRRFFYETDLPSS